MSEGRRTRALAAGNSLPRVWELSTNLPLEMSLISTGVAGFSSLRGPSADGVGGAVSAAAPVGGKGRAAGAAPILKGEYQLRPALTRRPLGAGELCQFRHRRLDREGEGPQVALDVPQAHLVLLQGSAHLCWLGCRRTALESRQRHRVGRFFCDLGGDSALLE